MYDRVAPTVKVGIYHCMFILQNVAENEKAEHTIGTVFSNYQDDPDVTAVLYIILVVLVEVVKLMYLWPRVPSICGVLINMSNIKVPVLKF